MSTGAAVGGALEIRIAAWSDPGRARAENQDHYLVADLSVPRAEGGLFLDLDEQPGLPESSRVRPGPLGVLVLVADGMGGAAGGRIASHFAAAWTYRELVARLDATLPPGYAPVVEAMKAAIEAANVRVHEQGQRTPEYQGMGSTVTAVLLLEGAFHAAQIGDSRAYIIRGGEAHRLTRDQSLVQKLVDAGALTPEQALASPQANLLLQALGHAPTVDVELTWQPAHRGDVLVVCSDGLYRVLTDAEIAAAAAIDDPATICRVLVGTANERGAPDNVTVVAARVEEGVVVSRIPGELPPGPPHEPVAG